MEVDVKVQWLLAIDPKTKHESHTISSRRKKGRAKDGERGVNDEERGTLFMIVIMMMMRVMIMI